MPTRSSVPPRARRTPAAPGARPRSRPRGVARREALLDAVLQIVAEVGADAVTHRRVAEVAELPLASTTYWFDSKEHLLTAALALAAERDIARLAQTERTLDDAGADPLDAAVDTIVEPLDDRHPGSRGALTATYALLLEAARRPPLRAIAGEWTQAYLTALGRRLARAGSAHPEQDARLLLAAADGLLIEQLSRGTAADLRPPLRRLAGALVSAR